MDYVMTGIRRVVKLASTLVVLAALFSFSGTLSGQVVSETGSFDPNKFSDKQFVLYEKQLNALLKTRRDEEKAFVRGVVLAVREGKLPSKLVQTTYGWVRNKRPNTKYPFVFFERVLRLQAAKSKLASNVVPAFDYRVYRRVITPTR